MVNTTPADVAGLPLLQKMGCTLGVIDRFAYPGLPDETQLLWWRALASGDLSALACRLPAETP